MKTNKTIRNITLIALMIIITAGCGGSKYSYIFDNPKSSWSDEQIGYRKVSLQKEEPIILKTPQYSNSAPGSSQKIDRAYENAPPVIPHSVEGLLPITKDNNSCVSCHAPSVAKVMGATAMSKSHMVDLRTNEHLAQMDNSRFNCTTCHVAQATNVESGLSNNFVPEFRRKDGQRKSNLLEIINEGVK